MSWRSSTSYREPRAGRIEIGENQAAQVNAVVDYIQRNTDPADTIFDFSGQGSYYFFADRPLATRYSSISYAVIEAMQNEIIADLERHRTKLVIFAVDAIDGIPNTLRQHLVAEYLAATYVEAGSAGNVVVLQRKQ